MWDDWDQIADAQQAAAREAEQRQHERGVRHEARQRGDVLQEAEAVAAGEVDRLAAEGREAIRALTGTAPTPSEAPEAVSGARSGATLSRWDPDLGHNVTTPIPPRPSLDDASGIRLWINDLRALAGRLRQ